MTTSAASSNAGPFPYAGADYEEIACNLCGGTDAEPVETIDRNGLPVKSVICRKCGLMYLSPRMKPAWYGRYYDGEYRRQMAEFRGRKPTKTDESATFRQQLRHGAWLADWLQARGVKQPRRIMDIGSGTGGILKALADRFGAEVCGVEPSPDEARFARQQGVPTEVGLFEEVDLHPTEPFDLVLCTQTFNHVLDPRAVATKVRSLLSPGGQFLIECQDFLQMCRMWGAIRYAIQIDHVTMFAPQTLRGLLMAAGFEVPLETMTCDRDLSRERRAQQQASGTPTQHIRLLARPCETPNQDGSCYEEIRQELDQLPNAPWVGKLRVQKMRWRLAVTSRLRRARQILNRRGPTRRAA